jgi:hypothetical protein
VAWQTRVLVVANQTAGSDELIDTLRGRAERGPAAFTLVVPSGPSGREDARRQLEKALGRMREAGLECDGQLGGDLNPLYAISEVWDARSYDEIVISTFPTGVSHWLNIDLPQRVAKLTDAPVEHVVSESTPPPAPVRPAPSGRTGSAEFISHFFGSKEREAS